MSIEATRRVAEVERLRQPVGYDQRKHMHRLVRSVSVTEMI